MTELDQLEQLEQIRRELAEVDSELAALGQVDRAIEHREAMRLLRERFETRFEALSGAHAAAASLRSISSPSEMLRRAPDVLTTQTGFRRAIVSLLQDSVLIPLAASFTTDGSGADAESAAEAAREALEQLREQPVRLEHHMVESDVLRRRRATLVTNVKLSPRVDQRMSALLGWSSYVAAPLLSGAVVIGMIHADRGASQQIDPLDRDVLWEFASVLSQISESAELRRALRHDREALRRFSDRVTALSAALSEAPITFSAYVQGDAEPPPQATTMPAAAVPGEVAGDGLGDDRLVLSGLLTRRELDVLRLLAEGGTNRTIADALVLSDTTVKFHVNSILRKLRVANRAEAVARYLSLTGHTFSV